MRKIYQISVCLALLSALVGGCSRKVESLDPVRSLPDPLAAPINVTSFIGDRSVTLNWDMPIATGVSYYRIYMADSSTSDFSLRDTSYSLTQTITGLLYNQDYVFTVAAVRSSGDEGKRSKAAAVRMPVLSLILQNNAEFTNRRTVNVNLNAGAGAISFQMSEDLTFALAQTEPFSVQKQFELSTGDGLKRVYGRFYYTGGAQTNAAIYDEITLDTRAQITSFGFAPSNTNFQTGETITFTLTAGETNGTASASFVGEPEISLYDDGISPDVVANDGTYSGRYMIPVGKSASGVEVTGDFTDAAGNEALQTKAPNLLTIRSTPQAVSIVSTFPLSTYQILVNWTQATSPNFQAYRLYRGNTNNVTNSSTLVTSIEAKAAAGFTDTALDANTMYYYRVYVVDSFGLSAASNVDSARTEVNTAPSLVVLAGTLTDSSHFRLSWTKSDEKDFASYRLYRKDAPGVTTDDQLLQVFNSQGDDSFVDYVPGTVTLYYRIFVFDRHDLNTGSLEMQLTK